MKKGPEEGDKKEDFWCNEEDYSSTKADSYQGRVETLESPFPDNVSSPLNYN